MKKLNGFAALLSAVLFLSSVSLVACNHNPNPGKSDPSAAVTETGITVTAVESEFTVGDEITEDDFVVKVETSDGKKTATKNFELSIPEANLDAEGKLIRSENSEGNSEEVVVTITYKTFTKTVTITVKDAAPADEDPAGDPEDPVETAYEVTFSADGNTSSYEDGVYTLTINAVQAESGTWGNQIFIKNPNTAANIAAGDLIVAKLTAEADKEIKQLFVKDQFNGGNYTGIDIIKNVPANTPVDFEIVGTVTSDYDASSSFVLDVRGNEAGTVLKLSKISVAKLGDYDVESVTLEATTTSPAAGETVTFTAKDQYGVVITEGVTYEITSADAVSTISGAVLTTGTVAETVTVKAKCGEIESNEITIVVTPVKDFNKYWEPEVSSQDGDSAPKGYFSIWADKNWCGSNVTLSDMNATETGCTLTRTVTGGCWFGTQIWYGLEGVCDVTFKMTSSVAGTVTVNSVGYELEANVAKEVTIKGLSGRVGVQLGKEGGDQLPDCTFTITDFVVTPAN